MKKLILIGLLAFGAWDYYQKNSTQSIVTAAEPDSPTQQAISSRAVDQQSATSFRCDGRQHCSQMTSRAEAEFFLKNCPNTKMDGDHDGIPCENDSRF